MKPYPSFLASCRGLLWLISLALLPACTNTDPTTGTTKAEGQVVEQQSRQPVGGGTVQVYLASSAGGYRPVGGPYPCDGQGKFTFDFDAEKKNGYLLLAEAPPGYITDWAEAPELTAGRQNKNVVVPVLAPAWVRLVLVDELPVNNISMFISGYSGSGDRLTYPHNLTLIRPVSADFARKIIWVITDEKGKDTQYEQAIKPSALDTVTVRIAF